MHPEYNNDIREFLPREIHLQRMRASEQVGFDHIALLTALFILKELFMAEVYFPSVYDQECQSVRPKIFAPEPVRPEFHSLRDRSPTGLECTGSVRPYFMYVLSAYTLANHRSCVILKIQMVHSLKPVHISSTIFKN